MKKFSFLAMAAVAALFSSCSSELVPEEVPGIGNEIRVRATAESHTRAAESYCNKTLPAEFQLYAWTTDGTPYIADATLEKVPNGGSSYQFKGDYRYWPKDQNLDFIAHRSANGTFNGSTKQFDNYEIECNVADQLDLLYSVKNNAEAANGTVNLNFRHALSQIVFRMKVTNQSLKVNVRSVEIGHLYDKGTFVIPTDENTDYNWVDYDHDDVLSSDINSITDHWKDRGFTSNDTYPYASYEVSLMNTEHSPAIPVTVTPEDGVVPLTQTPKDHENGYGSKSVWAKVMTLLPQKQDAWNPTESPNQFNGSYVCLDCDIINVCGENETPIHTGPTYIPLAVDWKEGIRYIYTFDFANGDGGNSGPTPDPDDPDGPKPTLKNIRVDVTTDDFISAENEGTSTLEEFNYRIIYYPNRHGQIEPSKWDDNGKEVFVNMSSPWEFRIDYYIENPVWAPHVFRGWSTSKRRGDAYSWENDETVSTLTLTEDKSLNKDANNKIDLFGVWEYHFVVHYDVNKPQEDAEINGTMIEDEDVVPHYTTIADFQNDYTINLKQPQWTCGEYEFIGWSFDKNATSANIKSVGASIYNNQAEHTVYAVWKRK